MGLGLLAAACGETETGKYTTGPDDPARKVTEKDIAQVKQVLEEQKKADEAKGLTRRGASAAVASSSSADPHAGVPGAPPIGSASGAASAPAAAADSGVLQIKSIYVKLPEGWKSQPPSTQMRLAEIAIPPASGDADPGEITVTHFGPDAGGVDANIARWIGQMKQPDARDSAEMARTESFQARGMKVTLLDVSGTMDAPPMPGVPSKGRKEGWRLLGGIVESPEGPYFFKGIGPEKTMAANRDKMVEFLRSAGSTPPAGSPPAAQAMDLHGRPPEPKSPTLTQAELPAAPSTPTTPASATGDTVKIRAYETTLPAGWKSVPPASSMRAAEFTIPAAEGDPEPGQMAVFYFGPEAGSVQANVDRWIGQFSQPDGSDSASKARQEDLIAGDMDIKLLDLSGTMAPSNMPGAPATPERPNWRLLGAIAMTNEGPYFFKATGPEKTLGAQRDAMIAFLKGLRPAGSPPAAAAPAPSAPVPAPAEPAKPQPAPQAAAPAPAPAPPSSGKKVELQGLVGELPADWKQVPPASQMRMAEFQLPPAPGDPEPGVITVFYLGPGGGGIESNIDRWLGQFEQPDGRPSKDAAVREALKAGQLNVYIVDLTGTMLPSNMPGAPQTGEKKNWRLVGGIVDAPEGPYFFKGTGPEKTMGDHKDRFLAFLTGLKAK